MRRLNQGNQDYYGVRMPIAVRYPPNEPDVVKHYEELSNYVQDHAIDSFTLLNS